jgi:hypothetical protein
MVRAYHIRTILWDLNTQEEVNLDTFSIMFLKMDDGLAVVFQKADRQLIG